MSFWSLGVTVLGVTQGSLMNKKHIYHIPSQPGGWGPLVKLYSKGFSWFISGLAIVYGSYNYR